MSGCETPAQTAVWEYEGDEYYSCPVLFIPETVKRWYEEYRYCKAFPGAAPRYHEVSARWVEAMVVYESAFNELQAEISAKQRQQQEARFRASTAAPKRG